MLHLKQLVMDMYEGYNFWGMHVIWWFIWVILLLWMFATPYEVPGQRSRKDTPLDVLKKRFASGEITIAEYEELREYLQ